MASGAISEYFEAQNGNGQACGRKFAAFLAREFPGLRPDLSFSLPMRRVGRKRNEGYAAFSAAKTHFSIRFSDADYAARPGAELPSCKAGKRCINIQYGDEQTSAAVQETVKAFLGELPMKEKSRYAAEVFQTIAGRRNVELKLRKKTGRT